MPLARVDSLLACAALLPLGAALDDANNSEALLARDPECAFYQGRNGFDIQPFYFSPTGGALSPGKEGVLPTCDSAVGAYFFEDTACLEGPCCNLNEHSASMASLSKILMVGGSVLLILVVFVAGGGLPMLAQTCDNKTGWSLFVIGTLYQIMLGVVLPLLQQRELPVEARNAMSAAGAFLTPISEGFSFIEDSVTVQISQAVGAGDLDFAQLVLALGTVGGFGLGIFGAITMTILACIKPVLTALVAPGHEIIAGCGLTHGPGDIADMVQVYWLTCVWGWPLSFANNAMSGYLLGLRLVGTLGLAMIVSGVFALLVWVVFEPKTVSLAGWSGFSSSLAFVIICAVCISVQLRRSGRQAAFSKEGRSRFWASGKEVLKDDLQALIIDLALQMGITIGTYTAGSLGIAVFYQLTALQSSMPMYGAAQSTMLNYCLKLSGGALIGAKDYIRFRVVCVVCLLIAMVYAALALATVIPFRFSMAFYWGGSACSFASSSACLPVYANVFGDSKENGVPLQTSMVLMAFASGGQSIFSVAKAGLYCCNDYSFMAVMAVVVVVVVFIPLILVAKFIVKEAASVFFAMYFPYVLLALIFTLRLAWNCHRMLCGRPGPWDRAATPAAQDVAGEHKAEGAAEEVADDKFDYDDSDEDSDSKDGSESESDECCTPTPMPVSTGLKSLRPPVRSLLSIPELAAASMAAPTSSLVLPSTGVFRYRSAGLRM